MQIVHLFLTDRILGAWDSSGCPGSCTFSGYKSSVLGDLVAGGGGRYL